MLVLAVRYGLGITVYQFKLHLMDPQRLGIVLTMRKTTLEGGSDERNHRNLGSNKTAVHRYGHKPHEGSDRWQAGPVQLPECSTMGSANLRSGVLRKHAPGKSLAAGLGG